MKSKSDQQDSVTIFRNEAELIIGLTRSLQNEGYRVRREVSNMGQSMDVVATRGRWVTVIEAKLRDWRRALVQCRAHEQVADFICIAIASATVSPSLAQEAERSGYGIIHFCRASQSFQWVRRPSRNQRVWSPQRQHWARNTKRVEYAN